jgi:trk system potassium uptake protein TrkH
LLLLDAQVRSLQFAVRPRVVAKYLGQLLAPLAVLLLVPLAVSVAWAPFPATLTLAATAALLAAVAVPSARLEVPEDLQRNEAIVVTALTFTLASLALTPAMAAYGLGWADAWFHAVSAVTTTGLTTLPPGFDPGFAFHFLGAWVQWVGGLGVLVLALALLMHSGPALARLGVDERETESLAGGTRAHARHALAVYALLSVVALLALLALGVAPGSALLHVMAGASTGGFSPLPGNAAGLEGWDARGVLIALCFAGAVSFSFYYRGLYRSPRAVWADPALRILLAMTALAFAAVWWLESVTPGAAAADARDAAFMVISAQATAGFSTVDAGAMSPGSQLVMVLSMFTGGDVGSTAGGIKLLRLLILLRLLELVVARVSVARGTRLVVRVEGRRVVPREVEMAVALVIGFLALIALSWLVFLAAGLPPLGALFDVVSAITNTGLSTGVAAHDLSAPLKGLLCLGMLAGRVEIIGLVVLLYPATGFGKRRG